MQIKTERHFLPGSSDTNPVNGLQRIRAGQCGVAGGIGSTAWGSNGFTSTEITQLATEIETTGRGVLLEFVAIQSPSIASITAGQPSRGGFGPCTGDAAIVCVNEITGQTVGSLNVGSSSNTYVAHHAFFDPAPPAGIQRYRFYRFNNASLGVQDPQILIREI